MKRVPKVLRQLVKDWYINSYGYYQNQSIAKYIEGLVDTEYNCTLERDFKNGFPYANCRSNINGAIVCYEVFT